ncbi:MAG: acyl-[acyl-carrier-protein]--UDP-N-acetylglucosamine O-acyltransferase [Deltaproteobacteria bacterium RIFCSPHIGHO2_12_FULL_43_9]|nr:MAG: acyl-[acyl-carrier-protein]--UDP-N-acetylglucosamine O-acyltransferase [Deltaproteobacteria bacterium RIFCSPHIGHO2_12_FULL_43_9]
MAVQIHPTAVVDRAAVLDTDLTIGPYSIIGPKVEIGSGTVIGSHVVIEGKTKIGKNNSIYQFSALGGAPQDLKFKGEDVGLEIGENNVLREYVNIHMGTIHGNRITRIGNNNLIMSNVHIGHDCSIGNGCVISTGTGLSGHVVLEEGVILGGMVGASQRVRIGKMAYIGGFTAIARDVPPFITGRGTSDIYIKGINSIGLSRKGVPEENIRALKKAYRTIFLTGNTVGLGCEKAKAEVGNYPEVDYFISFIQNSKNGICVTEEKAWRVQRSPLESGLSA